MDKLEDFIRKNRNDLDRYSPSDEMWDRIHGNSGISGRRMRLIWLTSAAMVAVILGTSVLFYSGYQRRSLISNNSEALIMKANPQLKEAEIYYNTMYTDLLNEASPLLTSNPEVKTELMSDLSRVDSICIAIKRDLKDNVSNQEVIEALLNNYRTKIRILEDMLVVLKENEKNNEKGENYAL